ncbi:MotA/TolQ/ExbB proton channel family protein [bacterium]|nr:MotA/TolQ/ExbB proton channel family protein [bacterium]MCP5461564.1 MotA/TolQ/ExbB proton channel family protein [bacterium]
MSSLFTMIEQGGFIMIPIMFCSILAVTVVIERIIALRKSKIIPQTLITHIDHFTVSNKGPILALCTKLKTPFSIITKKLLTNDHLAHETAADLVKISGRQETKGLDRGLFLLELIAAITPLMGLLGTVLGMIEIFSTISQGGIGQAEALSGGISKALITTVAGLSVAIPTLAAYTLLSRKVEALTGEIDRQITTLYGKIYGINIE